MSNERTNSSANDIHTHEYHPLPKQPSFRIDSSTLYTFWPTSEWVPQCDINPLASRYRKPQGPGKSRLKPKPCSILSISSRQRYISFYVYNTGGQAIRMWPNTATFNRLKRVQITCVDLAIVPRLFYYTPFSRVRYLALDSGQVYPTLAVCNEVLQLFPRLEHLVLVTAPWVSTLLTLFTHELPHLQVHVVSRLEQS